MELLLSSPSTLHSMVLLFRIENSLKALSKFTAVLGLLPLGLEGHGLGIEPVWKNLQQHHMESSWWWQKVLQPKYFHDLG